MLRCSFFGIQSSTAERSLGFHAVLIKEAAACFTVFSRERWMLELFSCCSVSLGWDRAFQGLTKKKLYIFSLTRFIFFYLAVSSHVRYFMIVQGDRGVFSTFIYLSYFKYFFRNGLPVLPSLSTKKQLNIACILHAFIFKLWKKWRKDIKLNISALVLTPTVSIILTESIC